MPKIHKRYCDTCGKYYESTGKKYCSSVCHVYKMKGHIAYNKITLPDKTFYPPIPDLCHCDNHCNIIVYDGNKYVHGHNSVGINNPMYGTKSWCKGLTNNTNEIIKLRSEKISKALTGKKMSEERKIKHIERLRQHPSMLGKHHKESTKEKQKQSKLGKLNHRYGKPAPEKAGTGKRSYYNSPLQGTVSFRSSYELKYAQYLDQNHVLWVYEMETFPLSDEMTYTPDFFLTKENKFIEIKGYMYPEAKIKIDKFIKEYPWDLEVLDYKKLKKMNIL